MKEIKLNGILQKLLVFNAVNTVNNYKMKLQCVSISSPYPAVNTPPVSLYFYSPDTPS